MIIKNGNWGKWPQKRLKTGLRILKMRCPHQAQSMSDSKAPKLSSTGGLQGLPTPKRVRPGWCRTGPWVDFGPKKGTRGKWPPKRPIIGLRILRMRCPHLAQSMSDSKAPKLSSTGGPQGLPTPKRVRPGWSRTGPWVDFGHKK